MKLEFEEVLPELIRILGKWFLGLDEGGALMAGGLLLWCVVSCCLMSCRLLSFLSFLTCIHWRFQQVIGIQRPRR